MIEEIRTEMDAMPFEERLFVMAMIAGHLADEDMGRTMAALDNIKASLLRLEPVH